MKEGKKEEGEKEEEEMKEGRVGKRRWNMLITP